MFAHKILEEERKKGKEWERIVVVMYVYIHASLGISIIVRSGSRLRSCRVPWDCSSPKSPSIATFGRNRQSPTAQEESGKFGEWKIEHRGRPLLRSQHTSTVCQYRQKVRLENPYFHPIYPDMHLRWLKLVTTPVPTPLDRVQIETIPRYPQILIHKLVRNFAVKLNHVVFSRVCCLTGNCRCVKSIQ